MTTYEILMLLAFAGFVASATYFINRMEDSDDGNDYNLERGIQEDHRVSGKQDACKNCKRAACKSPDRSES